eukprot:2-Eustigmatos_ZCMA.PRE.7
MGTIQRRRGPNVVGFQGLMQPLADGLKLFVKESVLPSNANKVLFIIAPMITFGLSLMGWVVIPFGNGLVLADINVGILYLLGALRSAAQMVSYEVSLETNRHPFDLPEAEAELVG